MPFDDDSIQLWDDDERCAAEVRRLSPRDVAGWRARVEATPRQSCTVKSTIALRDLPRFRARPDSQYIHWGQIKPPLTKPEWREYHRLANAGLLPPRL